MKLRTLYNQKRRLLWLRSFSNKCLRRYTSKLNPQWGYGIDMKIYDTLKAQATEQVNFYLKRKRVKRSKGSRKFYWKTNKKK